MADQFHQAIVPLANKTAEDLIKGLFLNSISPTIAGILNSKSAMPLQQTIDKAINIDIGLGLSNSCNKTFARDSHKTRNNCDESHRLKLGNASGSSDYGRKNE
ncbi:hypothetical protein CHUAL_001640 [Chamberlinius hualienensis]